MTAPATSGKISVLIFFRVNPKVASHLSSFQFWLLVLNLSNLSGHVSKFNNDNPWIIGRIVALQESF